MLILLDSYLGVGCDGVEVLLDFEGNVLCEHLHCVCDSADVESKVFVLDDTQEFTITFFKEELAFLLKDRDVDVSIAKVVISKLYDID